MQSEETLLMTGTIHPNKKIKTFGYDDSLNPGERLRWYRQSIYFYITQTKFTNIVFCENSNYEDSWLNNAIKVAKEFGKNIEYISFEGDSEKTVEKSHSYGDGEIIDYAVDHSKLLKTSKNFYKISGRYIISNIDIIIDYTKDYENFFFRHIHRGSFFGINTAFFKIDKEIYKNYFYDIKTTVKVGYSLEEAYFNTIKHNDITSGPLKIIPIRQGQGEWDLHFYHYIFLWLNLWNSKSFLGDLVDRIIYEHPKFLAIIRKFAKNFFS